MSNILIFICLALIGCSDGIPMKREDAIKATKECRDANMKPYIIFNSWGTSVKDIECRP
jgi:hypothetical protein